jgi:hypothetical protein
LKRSPVNTTTTDSATVIARVASRRSLSLSLSLSSERDSLSLSLSLERERERERITMK